MKIRVGGLVFQCDNNIARARAESLFTKEPGTIAWLRGVQSGDVFWDIGANVGCYTLLAAKWGAQVFAFEPHLHTAALLWHNVRLNQFEDRVVIITTPLDNMPGVATFALTTDKAGSSGHSVSTTSMSILQQRVYVTTGAWLLGTGELPRPTLLKIDVDGNELRVLQGFGSWLTDQGLRGVQVEMPPLTAEAIRLLMEKRRFTRSYDHYTQNGQQMLAQGVDPANVVGNTVFERGM